MTPLRCIALAAAGLGAATTAEARQGTPPDYGLDWVTVGAPGNRAASVEEAPLLFGLQVGSVPYEYRLARTELTVGHWLEFVQAYAPTWISNGGHPRDLQLTGRWIELTPMGYEIATPGAEDYPTDTGWRLAARYCNWLHNGKASEAWAFETGAYDTATFGIGPDGVPTDQITRSPGARFWIPSGDEWTKGVYFDPNRYGEGEAGYWLYPHQNDAPPISGLPQEGGETNAGHGVYPLQGMDVGSYPGSVSPWGLLDGSGGMGEWTESILNDPGSRLLLGSRISSDTYTAVDRLDWYWRGAAFPSGSGGLRVASAVPTPASGAGVFASWIVILAHRRIRRR